MVLLTNWEAYQREAKLLYAEDPWHFRVSIKYRHDKKKAVIKATTNARCLKHITQEAEGLRRYTSLLSWFTGSMSATKSVEDKVEAVRCEMSAPL